MNEPFGLPGVGVPNEPDAMLPVLSRRIRKRAKPLAPAALELGGEVSMLPLAEAAAGGSGSAAALAVFLEDRMEASLDMRLDLAAGGGGGRKAAPSCRQRIGRWRKLL